jgi:mRNA-degrading endonuclease YafQ of YafQ-DinJ toxin-antitoxin module
MEISFSSAFKKSFKKRILSKKVENEFWQCVEIFIENPFNAALKTHKLKRKLKELWSFSIEYDLRVVFYFTKSKPIKAVFVDIGTHDEVY